MRCPSAKRLLAAFPKDLTPEKVRLIRKLAAAHSDPTYLRAGTYWGKLASLVEVHCPKTHAHVRQCHGDPFDSHLWATTMCLEAIDELLGTCGVEPLEPVGVHNMRTGPRFEYLSQGDPYTTTLIYSRENGADNLFIGCWGDIAERHPNW